LEFQGSWPQDYQVSVGLKDLSFPASTRENQSSLGLSFSSWPPSLRNLDMLSSMQVVPNMELQVELFNCKYFHTIRSLCWLYKNVGNTTILIPKLTFFQQVYVRAICALTITSSVSRLMTTVLGDFYPWSMPGFSWYHCIFEVWFNFLTIYFIFH